MAAPLIDVTDRIEVEQVEQVADGRHVPRHINIVGVLNGIGQIVATAITERAAEQPIALDKLHKRGMFVIDVADMTAD